MGRSLAGLPGFSQSHRVRCGINPQALGETIRELSRLGKTGTAKRLFAECDRSTRIFTYTSVGIMNKGKPLDSHTINRINHLWYLCEMKSKTDIAKRLDISIFAVRKYLYPTKEKWEKSKAE
jgi:hypothetical protein